MPEFEISDRPQSLPFTIILPMRDEKKNVERKLKEVIREIMPHTSTDVIVVDSASSDGTAEIAEELLKMSALSTERWSLIKSTIPGKSRAINLALASSESSHFIMMDADSVVESGWLDFFQRVFTDPEIGSVSGIENIQLDEGWRGHYRTNANRIRIMESRMGSTTVLEGGLIAWKSDITNSIPLVEESNGDDSQLALSSIRLGYRSIVLEGLIFSDTSKSNQLQRSIRRSQGLTRNFLRNWDLIFTARDLQSKVVVATSVLTYVIFPWCYLICLLSTFYLLTYATPVDRIFLIPLFTIVLSLLDPRGRSVMVGSILTLISHIQFFFGRRYGEWKPMRE